MREYELVLMLDPGQDAPARDAVAKEARGQIEAAGTLKHEKEWGLRKLAYEIAQRTEADYRWFRFEGTSELLEQLDHNLKIADGVLRFRIFKVSPETPVTVPPATAAPGPAASRERPAEPAAAEAAPAIESTEEPAEAEAASEPAGDAGGPAVAEATEEAPPEPAPSGEGDEQAESAA
jgi:small subunit ribosomal protein S6